LGRAVEIDVVLEVGDHHAGARAAWKGVQQPFQRADGQVAERGRADRLALGHLEVARHLVEEDQDRVSAKDFGPFIDAGGLGAVAPEGRHDVGLPELLGDVTPEQGVGVLEAAEDHHLGGAELAAAGDRRGDLPTQGGVLGDQAERDQAVGLAAAHGLGEVEGAILRAAGQPIEPAPDQQLEAIGEEIAAEELSSVDLAGGQGLDLSDLLDQAVALDESARGTELLDRGYRHGWVRLMRLSMPIDVSSAAVRMACGFTADPARARHGESTPPTGSSESVVRRMA